MSSNIELTYDLLFEKTKRIHFSEKSIVYTDCLQSPVRVYHISLNKV